MQLVSPGAADAYAPRHDACLDDGLGVESVAGKGARFEVYLPRYAAAEAPAPARAQRRDLKVVLVSGYSPEFLREDPSLETSAVFLPKPFKSSDLLRAVRGALEGAASSRARPG